MNHPDAHAARARHARKNLKHLGGKGPGSRGGGKATPFDEVLQYHADGLVPHAPVRDVRLSAASIAQVKLAVAKLWRERVSDRARTAQPPQPPLHLPEPAPTPPREVPPGIAATGRTDLNFFTFGIGGGKDLAERAIASGHFTGFRKLGPRQPPLAVPLPVQPKGGSPATAKVAAPHAVPLPRVAMSPALASHTVPLSHVSLPVYGTMPHAVPLRLVAAKPVQVVPEPELSPEETIPPFGT